MHAATNCELQNHTHKPMNQLRILIPQITWTHHMPDHHVYENLTLASQRNDPETNSQPRSHDQTKRRAPPERVHELKIPRVPKLKLRLLTLPGSVGSQSRPKRLSPPSPPLLPPPSPPAAASMAAAGEGCQRRRELGNGREGRGGARENCNGIG
jgi:hypothetical protein